VMQASVLVEMLPKLIKGEESKEHVRVWLHSVMLMLQIASCALNTL